VRVGRYEITSVVDAYFAVDGGAMFGVVPRPLWERHAPADARNRVRLAARCLVAVDADARRVLVVDDGLGDKWDARRTELLAIDRSGVGLEAGLARLGLGRTDVTDVLLTHLHLDHAGGTTRRGPDGRLELTFPRATYHLQRRAWQHAHAPTEKDAAAFVADDFAPLQHSNQLHLVEGEAALFPGVELIVSEGHTPGQQLPRFRGDGTHVTFAGDVIPTHAHLRPSWVMAFDLLPVTTMEEKKVLAAEALEDGGVLVFGHDPRMAACRLGEEEGRPVFREAVDI
jgi:glyoxylase-like metal-dependent hydrolase (beta-lactamase superfamily II)